MLSATATKAADDARMLERLNLIRGSKAIADFIGVSQRDVLNEVHKGSMPAFILGNKLVARPESLREWVAQKELEAALKRAGAL